MATRSILIAVLALMSGAAFLLFRGPLAAPGSGANAFVQTRGSKFVVEGRPFRFVGANVAVMHRDEDRERMPETLARAAQSGIRVVRVWAFGEGGPKDVQPIADLADWPRLHPFRWDPDHWNEEAFVHLDHVIAAAAQRDLRVQLCLTNWWRDTGGVTQYLRWAGINDAADDRFPFGINNERAMLFYTNEQTRRLYREHIEKLVTRRNTVTGIYYRDDPAIFGWELMNEAQVVTGRWAERRAWINEMSSFLKSLDPNHVVAPGVWGYRSAAERREWLADHSLPNVDYCDIHIYPRPDVDSFVDSPAALRQFIDNRAAAAFSINKPLVLGEFGIGLDGFEGFSQAQWYRAFFESNLRAGAAGAMFWILTPDPNRGYGVAYSTPRDEAIFAEIKRGAGLFASLESADPPASLTQAGRHLVPRQFMFMRSANDPGTLPDVIVREDRSILYRFKPHMATAMRFEKLGDGIGYIWGFGSGSIEYRVPARRDRRRVSELIVRAHIQPVLPIDARPEAIKTQVTLFVNGSGCGSRVIPVEVSGKPLIQEWRIDGWLTRIRVARGMPLTIRFAVIPNADWLYGVNISNWPEGYDSRESKPIEVEIR